MAASCGGPPAPEKKAVPPAAAKITNFYASPAAIHKGEEALLCYGVEDAKWVKLDPPVEKLTPSFTRCFSVKPEKTTHYTLSVEGSSRGVDVTVGPAAPKAVEMIRLFVTDKPEVAPGERVTLCYGLVKARSAELNGKSVPVAERRCFEEQVTASTTFRLVVTGEDGRRQQAELPVKVK
ncbi:MAG: hypothetical protein IT166_02800 [Bryobacterales bacterium]|nr:hypothetical protein [Bryobacterales bacterium]